MAMRFPTFLRRGDLTLDWQPNGCVRLVRESTMQWVELSVTEWTFLVRSAELVGWPTVSPVSMAEILSRYTGMSQPGDSVSTDNLPG